MTTPRSPPSTPTPTSTPRASADGVYAGGGDAVQLAVQQQSLRGRARKRTPGRRVRRRAHGRQAGAREAGLREGADGRQACSRTGVREGGRASVQEGGLVGVRAGVLAGAGQRAVADAAHTVPRPPRSTASARLESLGLHGDGAILAVTCVGALRGVTPAHYKPHTLKGAASSAASSPRSSASSCGSPPWSRRRPTSLRQRR